MGREVQDIIDAAQRSPDVFRIGRVAINEFDGRGDKARPPSRMHSRLQIVEDADFVSPCQEQVHSMRADEAGSAGDETEGQGLPHRLVYRCGSPVAVKKGGVLAH